MIAPAADLLARLSRGDAAAADEVFRVYEPYLCLLVRRWLSPRLRAKFDSVDIVLSAWADLLAGFRQGRWHFTDADRLQAFLVRAVRNRFLNRLRQYQAALEHEQTLPDAALAEAARCRQPSPSDVVQAEDVWDQLLALCPPAHHELLRLRQQGAALAEIAARTGLHESSVRRIFYDLARRLTFRQPTSPER